MSRVKAGLIPVEDDVRARLGFYSNQVFLCMSILKWPGVYGIEQRIARERH